jgi:predicted ArsR family transcriptional regulator
MVDAKSYRNWIFLICVKIIPRRQMSKSDAMQQTRQLILDILRERGEATVDELVTDLEQRIQHGITAVTVRHHLDVLRGETLVTEPSIRRRSAPGRPQYVYALTDKAHEQFPNNYPALVKNLLGKMKATLSSPQVNVIFEGVADQMIADAKLPELPIERRLEFVVEYLNQHGYRASWEPCAEGFLLHTHNCPYHLVAGTHGEFCMMDMRLISGLVGYVPRQVGRIANQDQSCAYLIPYHRAE